MHGFSLAGSSAVSSSSSASFHALSRSHLTEPQSHELLALLRENTELLRLQAQLDNVRCTMDLLRSGLVAPTTTARDRLMTPEFRRALAHFAQLQLKLLALPSSSSSSSSKSGSKSGSMSGSAVSPIVNGGGSGYRLVNDLIAAATASMDAAPVGPSAAAASSSSSASSSSASASHPLCDQVRVTNASRAQTLGSALTAADLSALFATPVHAATLAKAMGEAIGGGISGSTAVAPPVQRPTNVVLASSFCVPGSEPVVADNDSLSDVLEADLGSTSDEEQDDEDEDEEEVEERQSKRMRGLDS